jgi:hypothetical protein
MSVLVSFEGILQTDLGAPLFDGILLTRSLLAGSRVVIAAHVPLGEVEHFLKTENIKGVSKVYGETPMLDALREERMQASVSMVFTADPYTALTVAQQGVTICLINASNFVRPDWKPNRKTWEDIANAHHFSRG